MKHSEFFKKENFYPFLRRALPAVGVFLIGFILTLFMFFMVEQEHDQFLKAKFNESIGRMVLTMEEKANMFDEVLRAGAALYAASNSVEEDEWHKFVNTYNVSKTNPSMIGIGYVHIDQPDKLELFVTDEALNKTDASDITRVQYVEPRTKFNQNLIGIDVWKNPITQEAMVLALKMNKATMSRIVRNQNINLAYVFLPTYAKSGTDLAEGFMFAVIDVTNLFQRLANNSDYRYINIGVYKGAHTTETTEKILEINRTSPPSFIEEVRTISFLNHGWTLQLLATEKFVSINKHENTLMVLGVGIAITLMLAYIVWTSRNTQISAENLVNERTSELEMQKRLLLRAEEIGKIGHWHYKVGEPEIFWSDEIYRIHGRDPDTYTPSLEEGINAYHPDDRPIVQEKLDQAIKNKTGFEFKLRIIQPGGEIIWVHSRAFPNINKQGKVESLFGVFQDITEQTMSEQQLINAKKQAEQASLSKSQFLANMSHEIRTPMNGIIGMAQLLERTKLDEEQKNYTHTLTKSANTLLFIIDDILDLAKVESGRIEIENITLNLKSLCEDVLELYRPNADEKELDLLLEMPEEMHLYYSGDLVRIRQVLSNLVSNAIKFTEQGSVSLKVEEAHNGKESIKLLVTDTGVGIPEEKQHSIFEQFSQADTSTTRQYGGTGLGLTICERLVSLMGGHIEVKSTVGEGSTFIVYLNLERTEAPKVEEDDVQELEPKERRKEKRVEKCANILLVEDNETNQMLAQAMLKKLGHQVDTVGNGAEAVDAVNNKNYDMILMDIQMPVMDGIEATKIIKQNMNGTAPPIIALTAHAMKGDAEKYMAAGMDGYLSKPVRFEELCKAILKAVA